MHNRNMKTVSRTLFGGALVAAGIVATQAHAAEFVFGVVSSPLPAASVSVAAYDFDSEGFIYEENASGPGPVSFSGTWNYAYIAGYGNGSITYTTVFADSYVTEGTASLLDGFGRTQTILSNSTVDVDSLATIDWDFSNGHFQNRAYIRDETSSSVIQSINAGAGSTSVILEAGHIYTIELRTVSTDLGYSFAGITLSAVVPTPGALTLLGAAGIVARRRRRR